MNNESLRTRELIKLESQMNIAKKIFAVATSSLLVVASVASFASLAHAAVHATGTNVVSNGTVYFLDGSTKRPYTSAGAFLSYGFNSWSGVVAASPEDLALQTGAFVPPMDGSLINDNGTVYLMTAGQRAGFTSASNFLGLGYSFSNVIAGDTSWMTSAALINSTSIAHPAGTLVNQAGTVYLMTATGKQGIPSLAVFNSWGYSFSKVAPANSYDAAVSMSAGIMPTFVAGCLSPLSCGSPITPVVPNGNVSVSVASDTPAQGQTIVAGQASADIANFAFSGSGTVTSLTFTRTGVSNNSAIDNVYLYQGTTRLTFGSSVSQNGVVTFSNANGLFTVNGSTEISVRADIDNNSSNIAGGQTIGFQLTSGMTAGTSVAGAPVSGNLSQVAISTNLATVTVGSGSTSPYGVLPTTTGATVNAGTMNYVLWSAPIQIGQHATTLSSASFEYIGSAATSAFQNWALYLDGAKVATSSGINSSNYVVFTPTAGNLAVNTGSHTLEVHADVIGGSNRNAQLTLQNGSDLLFTDTNYNVGVLPHDSWALTSTFAPVPGGLVNIANGTLSISLDPSFNTTTSIPAGATSTVIGSYQLQSYGENVQVNNLTLTPTISGYSASVASGTGSTVNTGGALTVAGTVAVAANSFTVTGTSTNFSPSWIGASFTSSTLTGTIVAVQSTTSMTISASQAGAIPAGATYTVTAAQVATNVVNVSTTTGIAAGELITFTGYGSYTIASVGTGTLTLSTTPSSVIPGGTAFNVTGVSGGPNGNLQNVSLFLNGSQVGTTQNYVAGQSLNFNFGSSFVVPASSTASILQVKADLQDNNGTNYSSGTITTSINIPVGSAQGQTSLQTNSSAYPASGQTLTVGGSSGTLSLNTALTSGSTVLSNTTGERIGSYIIQAGSAEGLRLNSLNIALAYNGVAYSGGPSTGLLGNSYMNNLKVTVTNCSGSTYTANPVNPQSTNTFSLTCAIAANSTAEVDVYADPGNAVGNVTTTLTAQWQGQVSNNSTTTAPLGGQVVYVNTGSITEPTLGASAAVSALIASATQPTVGPATTAAFNFVSNNGTSTIQEMYVGVYTPTGTTPITTGTATVTQITVSGPGANGVTSTATAPVVNGVAHVTGLQIQIPQGNAGQDVAITPTFNFVGVNGLTTGQEVRFGVSEFKYQSGQSTVDHTNTVKPYSNPMVVVAAYPTVVNSNGIVGVSSGATFGAGQQVLQFTVTAPASGPVRIKQIGVTPNYSAQTGDAFGTVGTPSVSSGTYKIYNTANPSSILNGSGSGQVYNTAASGSQIALTFTTPEVIAAGTSKTYTVTVDTTGLIKTGDSFRLDLTNSGDVVTNDTLAAINTAANNTQTSWAWNDSTVANQGTGTEQFLNGYLVQNLPVTGPTFVK